MELIIVIAVWTFFGVIINDMAKKRNRNQASWVILSLLLSPIIGVILLLIIGDNKESAA